MHNILPWQTLCCVLVLFLNFQTQISKYQEPHDVAYCCFLISIMDVGKYQGEGRENMHFRQR